MFRANIETDVSLTVAQISIVSVPLTYAGFGIHNVQNVHQKTTSSPTSCFYCNCFIGQATARIWTKQQFYVCVQSSIWKQRCQAEFLYWALSLSVTMTFRVWKDEWDDVSWEWTNGWNWICFTSTQLSSSTGKWWVNGVKKQKWQIESCVLTTLSAAVLAELKYWFFFYSSKGGSAPIASVFTVTEKMLQYLFIVQHLANI